MKRLIAAVILCLLATGTPAADWSSQRNGAGGVTVTVLPQDLGVSSKTWDFKVVLDTHSQDLTDDLLKTTPLLEDKGAKQTPIAWALRELRKSSPIPQLDSYQGR